MNHLLLLSAMSARIDVGYPWTRLYVSQPISDALYVFGLYEQVSVKRVQPSVGLSLKWVDRKWDINGGVLLGSIIQNAQISKKGSSTELRIVARKSEGTVRSWTRLGMRESLFVDRWIVESSSGIENQSLYDTELMLTGAMDVDILIKDWTFGFAMDLPWVDVPTLEFT